MSDWLHRTPAEDRLLTSREVAQALGVSESSAKRWADSGQIPVTRTLGGHRRIRLSDAIRFIRDKRLPLARPDLLGLPAGATSFSAAATPWAALRDALLAGDEERALESIFSAFLDGDPLAEIADGLISPAMEHLGTLWAHSPDGILVEHRAFDIVMRALRRIQDLLPRPAPGAPVAVGGAPPGDVYTMPSLCASLVFQEAGFRAINLGAQTPWETLILACRQYGPRAVWLSFSTERENGEDTIASLRRLAREGRKSGAIVYCGGAAMPEAIEKMKPENIQPLRRLAELESHLKSGGEPRERSRV